MELRGELMLTYLPTATKTAYSDSSVHTEEREKNREISECQRSARAVPHVASRLSNRMLIRMFMRMFIHMFIHMLIHMLIHV
jgi:hypothetical protein